MAAPKTRGLGKGLEALFGDSEFNAEEISVKKEETGRDGDITFVDINDIKPNANQPRKDFDEKKIEELALSIKEHGLIQPVVLRKSGQGYEIVVGERRWRASRQAELKEIPCIIKDLTDEQNMLMAIVENMQREDLNPVEEAEGLNQMITTFGFTQEQVSQNVGKSRPYITNALRLLKLPESVKSMILTGALTAGHARVLAGIKSEKKQEEIAGRVVRQGLSVRAIETLVKEQDTLKPDKPRQKTEKSPDIKMVERDLKERLGTKVTLNRNGEKGKIEIEYYSRDELDRLIDLLKTLK